MNEYVQYYDLRQQIEATPLLIPKPPLYNFEDGATYAAHMDMLAQPLPNGEPSPFSSKEPGSGHGVLMAVVTHLQRAHAHEFNLVPDVWWIEWFRALGAEMQQAEYPVINLVFERSPEAVFSRVTATIPANTEIRSTRDPNIAAYTLYEDGIYGDQQTVTIPARINVLGTLPNLRIGEMAELPRFLSFVGGVQNDGSVVSPGKDPETLVQAMMRVRDGLRSGSLAQDPIDGNFDPTNDRFQARCITDADFAYWAKRLGCDKVNVLSAIQYGVTNGVFADLTTLVVYPSTLQELVFNSMVGMTVEPRRFDVRSAELIPIDGTITVKVIPSVAERDVFDIVATAIAAKVNPPYGIWGDPNFSATLATALEESFSIYAVPEMQLKHAETGEPLSAIVAQPWHLFEIQKTLEVVTVR